MRFYLINRYFYPDESATALLLTDLAEDLAGKLHEVHVYTSRQIYNNPQANLPKFEIWQGVHIHRVFSTTFGRSTFWGRLSDIMTYRRSLYSVLKCNFSTPPDAWFVMTDPPLILEQVVKLKNRLGGRIIHHVDDLYPDLAIALGAIQNNILVKWLNYRSKKSLTACDTLLALGECMASLLMKKGIPENRIQITPPWADEKRLSPLSHRENPFRKALGFSDQDMVVMYSGNMGKGHSFETILEAARLLINERRIHFLFIGDGAKRKEIELFCKNNRLTNCQLLPYQPREKLRESLSAGDIHLISLDSRVQGLIVPSKLAGILAVGRPIIFVGDSQNSVAQAILNGKCGEVISEGSVGQLKESILKLYKNTELRQSFGKNARDLFEQKYSRGMVVQKIISCLEDGFKRS